MSRPDCPETVHNGGEGIRTKPDWIMRNTPHRLEWSRVLRQARNQVPMDVWQLIAEQFIVDLHRVPFLGEQGGHLGDFFDETAAFLAREMKEFGRVALQDEHRPAGKELVVVQIGVGETAIGDEMILARPGADTRLAGMVAHGWRRVRASSAVIRPFLSKS